MMAVVAALSTTITLAVGTLVGAHVNPRYRYLTEGVHVKTTWIR